VGVRKASSSKSDLQGHSRELAIVPFNRSHTIFYNCSFAMRSICHSQSGASRYCLGGQTSETSNGCGRLLWSVIVVCCRHRLSRSVTLHGGLAGSFTRAGQVMTSCGLQPAGGSVVLSLVRATPCYRKQGRLKKNCCCIVVFLESWKIEAAE